MTAHNLIVMLAVLVLGLAATAAGKSLRSTDGLLVQTTNGPVQGHINEVGVREWKGIPYAQPPAGELRWEYPKPSGAFQGTYQATFNAPGCPQHCNLPPGNCPTVTSEDCLYLSIFAPPTAAAPADKGLPVFFWIHGGAFEQGQGNCALYNGSTFAQHDVVTVVINYRLGAMGFLAAENMQGNYGILDQRLALQWVRDNINAFGGDANRITIGGQSAGAMSVGAHLVSSNSKGMFAAGIMESNPLALPFHTRASAADNAAAIFTYLNCAVQDVACMKSKTVDEILDAQDHAVKINLNDLLINFLPFAPMVEVGGEIPEQPFTAMAGGRMQSVPLLSGSVLDEGQLFVHELFTTPLDEMAYNVILKGVFGLNAAKKILKMYPYSMVPNTVDGRDALNILATDLLFYCPLRNMTKGYQKSIDTKTYIYRFKHIESFDCWGPGYTFCVGYVCHGSELPFVWNVFSDGVSIDYTPTSQEKTLTSDLGNAWTNFITTNNPNTGLPVYNFPIYNTKDELVVLDEPDHTTVDHLRTEYCDLWDTLGYYY